ncbi:CBS domain-containing protein [Tessaracoccus antarcticus]|uniref:CBS domain-containing protein n=1 Tax=Tessaracoccus antarcticus TaxID=2479848 RepID=A0A3M0G4X6_9ACTN|nr:CBS domain-containing protein [Tessaracoccus antarcticus]RMB59925.1 CBS domain-containing protein [Tessaracoccus antarcticus]
MKISEVIKKKGNRVVTIESGTTVADMLRMLDENRIGALVVSDDGGETVQGIASERDIVRALHQRGVEVLGKTVRSIMTSEVWTCTSDDELEALAVSMTEHRVRHLPVVDKGKLVAIVSIGDVVKHRLDELEAERNELFHYVQGDRSMT